MALSIGDIRKKYPDAGIKYCVGGAICNYIEPGISWFPGAPALAEFMMCENEALNFGVAYKLAQAIIEANDAGLIEHAWSIAERALNYGA